MLLTNNYSSARACKCSNRLTFKRHLKQMTEEKQARVLLSCFSSSRLFSFPSPQQPPCYLTWKRILSFSQGTCASSMLSTFPTSTDKPKGVIWMACGREERLIYKLSAAHQFDSLAVSLVFISRLHTSLLSLLSLIWWVSMNGLNIPKRSLMRPNQPSLPQPFLHSLCCRLPKWTP